MGKVCVKFILCAFIGIIISTAFFVPSVASAVVIDNTLIIVGQSYEIKDNLLNFKFKIKANTDWPITVGIDQFLLSVADGQKPIQATRETGGFFEPYSKSYLPRGYLSFGAVQDGMAVFYLSPNMNNEYPKKVYYWHNGTTYVVSNLK